MDELIWKRRPTVPARADRGPRPCPSRLRPANEPKVPRELQALRPHARRDRNGRRPRGRGQRHRRRRREEPRPFRPAQPRHHRAAPHAPQPPLPARDDLAAPLVGRRCPRLPAAFLIGRRRPGDGARPQDPRARRPFDPPGAVTRGGANARSVSEIAEFVGGRILGDAGAVVTGATSIEEAAPGSITFAEDVRHFARAEDCSASCVLVPPPFESDRKTLIQVEDPRFAFAKVLHLYAPALPVPHGIHPTAVISSEAGIGEEVAIGPHAVVEAGRDRRRGGPLREGIRRARARVERGRSSTRTRRFSTTVRSAQRHHSRRGRHRLGRLRLRHEGRKALRDPADRARRHRGELRDRRRNLPRFRAMTGVTLVKSGTQDRQPRSYRPQLRDRPRLLDHRAGGISDRRAWATAVWPGRWASPGTSRSARTPSSAQSGVTKSIPQSLCLGISRPTPQ